MNKELRLDGIYPLSAISDEQLSEFDCGKLSLNTWFEQKSRSNEASGGSRTYVLLTLDGKVAGFYCISNYCLAHEGARAAIRRNMPDPIPAVLLGRLAISKKFQGLGLGRALLRHAIENALKVAEITGAALFITEPIDEDAYAFYQHSGFSPIGKDLPFLAIKLHQLQNMSHRS